MSGYVGDLSREQEEALGKVGAQVMASPRSMLEGCESLSVEALRFSNVKACPRSGAVSVAASLSRLRVSRSH